MNAILKYPGAKWRIADWVIEHFPAHKVYLEPFFGSGAILFNKAAAQIETVNDLNGDIVNLFKTCREKPEELARLVELTPWAREEYIACAVSADNDLERARRTLVRYWQSFGTSNSSLKSWKNSQTSNSPRCPLQWAQLPEIIARTVERLRAVQIECTDAVKLIQRYDSAETLIYCDPPYLQGTRKRNMYSCEMSDEKHVELLETLRKSRSHIVLSAYDNELYNDMLSDWYTDEKPTIAQMGLPRVEKLYCNFKLNKTIFDICKGDNNDKNQGTKGAIC